MYPSIEMGFSAVWFDDLPTTIEDARKRLEDEGLDLHVFDDAEETRSHLVRSGRDPMCSLPDVVIADLRIEKKKTPQDEFETGLALTSFVRVLYRKCLKIIARMGVASAFQDEINNARQRDDLMFVSPKESIVGDGFRSFLRDLRTAALLCRRDLWCRLQDTVTPLNFDDLGGKLLPNPCYGVIARIDDRCVTVQTWHLDRIRSERIRHFPRRLFDAVATFDYGEPIRIIDACDEHNPGNVRSAVYIQKLNGLETKSHLVLCHKTDFSGFRGK